MTATRILIVEDDDAHVELLRRAYESAGREVAFTVVATCAEARDALEAATPDAVLADFVLPDGRGLDLLPYASARGCPLVLMTSHGDESVAVEAMRGGALDYVVKTPASLDAMPRTLDRALREHALVVGHRRAEEARRTSEERLRATLASLGDLVVGLDAQGRVRDLHVPASLAPFFGAARVGELLSALVPEDVELAIREAASDAIADDTIVERSVSLRERTFRARVSPRADGGITLAMRDETERRRAELERERLEGELHQVQRLETIGTLAGGIAHDFNNLLVPVLVGAELALLEIPNDAPVRRAVEQIVTAAIQARELVRRLLTFSRSSESTARSPMQLAPLVEDALELVRAMVPATTRLQAALDPQAGLVHGDSTQLNQVVVNVVLNAHQALPPEGGLVTITLAPVTITSAGLPDARPALSAGSYARLVIEDEGHGMEPKVLERIFEPFFTTKPPGRGTGLGLSVVHGIVKSHRGALRVMSSEGAGTRFEIYLPRMADAYRPILEMPHAPRGRGERVLVVDDQAPVAHALGRLLERLEYVPTVETEPEAALARLTEEPGAFDLVLTDLTMPTLSGIELATRIRAAGVAVPVVLVSGSWSSHDVTDLGLFAAVLPKPCDAATLATKLRLVLD